MPKKKPTTVPEEGDEIVRQAVLKLDHPRAPWYHSVERQGFIDGLFNEMKDQLQRYLTTVHDSADMQARLEIAERSLVATREHLKAMLSESEEEVPPNWETTLNQIKFVGTRLGDACLEVLREHKTVTVQEMMEHLNRGQFRFRTGAPLREIHAALLRHPEVKRDGDRWVYKTKRPRKAATMRRKAAQDESAGQS